ncbi:MAG TPA: hypothetical protein DCM38_13475 [Gammaproteobacteria bacterium]|nr:hypothetical protein [Gammaproteobacteria bacterium]
MKNDIDFQLKPVKIKSLFKNGVLKLDLQSFEKDIPRVLDVVSQQYTQLLYKIFSTHDDFCSKTSFRALNSDYQPNYKNEIQLLAPNHSLTLIKNKDSSVLEITLLVADNDYIPHATVIKGFILKPVLLLYCPPL